MKILKSRFREFRAKNPRAHRGLFITAQCVLYGIRSRGCRQFLMLSAAGSKQPAFLFLRGHRHGRMTGFAVKAFNLMVLSDRCRKGDRTKQDQKADERQIECFHSVQAL